MFTCFELAAVIAAERDYVQLIFNLNISREIIRAANDPSVFTITKSSVLNVKVLEAFSTRRKPYYGPSS